MVGIFTTDSNLIVGSWDDWLAQITGIPSIAARGQSLISLFPDLEKRGMRTRLERVIADGVVEVLAPAFHHYLFECPPAVSSKYFDMMQQRVSIAPLRENETIVGIIVTVEDVTARLDRERDLADQIARGDEITRLKAVKALAEQQDIESAEPLIERLGDESWRVRKSVVDGLSRHGGEHLVKTLLLAMREEHRNLSVLNSALQILALSGVDATAPLIECLSDPDVDLRVYSAHALGDQHDPRSTAALIRALEDPDPNVQYHAIEALGKLRAVEAVDALIGKVESGDFYQAFPALDTLTRIGDSRVAPRLVPLLEDEMLRVPAAEALGQLGDEEAVKPLVTLMNKPGAPVQSVALALATIYDRYEKMYGEGSYIADLASNLISASGAQNLLDALNDVDDDGLRALALISGWMEGEAVERALTRLLGRATARKEVVEALVRYGTRVTELLIEHLGSEDLETRQAAVISLGRIGDTRAVPALTQALANDEELVIPAAGALARIGDRRALDALLDLLGHPQPAVRQAVISAINSIGHPEMAQRAVGLLKDPDSRVRESAVQIAGYFGYVECVELLFERCHDEDEGVRRAAIEHLPYLDDNRVLSELAEAVENGTARVRASAVKALAQIEDSRTLSYLLAGLNDSDQWVRYFSARSIGLRKFHESLTALEQLAEKDPADHVRIAAIESLSQIGGARSAAILSRLAESNNADLARVALGGLGLIGHPDAMPPLLAAIRGHDPSRRIDAVLALGKRDEPGAVDALEWVAAADADERVVQAAIDALAGLATPAAVEKLVALTSDPSRRDACVAALSDLPKDRIEFIGKGLHHPQPAVRRAIVQTLGRMKHPLASNLLSLALEDEDAAIRSAAANALGYIGSRYAERKLVAMARTDSDPSVRRAAQRALRK